MRRMMERMDERMRTLLLRSICAKSGYCLSAMTAAAFFLLLMTRTLVQLAQAQPVMRAVGVLTLTLPVWIMALLAMRIVRSEGGSFLQGLLACALCALAMLARLSFIERSSGDYDIYLSNWLSKLSEGSFSECMRTNIGEYHVLYQYILFVITRLPVPPLYAVKAVSFIGDALLAGAAARLAAKNGRQSFGAFAAVLLLSTCVLNGGMFAQCDSLYAACALWGLALSLEGKPTRAAMCFTLSLAFKLQAVFLLPMVVVLWSGKKLRVCDAFVFAATLVVVLLPALLAGKSLLSVLDIYIAQTGLYTGLGYGAPNLFGLMNTTGLDVYAYGNFGMALAFGVCALLVYAGVSSGGTLDEDGYVRLSLLMVLSVVYLLPRMHERYFYLADALALVLAFRRRKTIPAAVLIALAGFSTYWDLGISLRAASLMLLTAWVFVAADRNSCCKNN